MSCRKLVNKSSDIVDFFCNTSSIMASVYSRKAFVQLLPTTQQVNAFTKPPRTSPYAASVTGEITNVIRFVRQCKVILSAHNGDSESSRPSNTCAVGPDRVQVILGECSLR